MEPEQIYVLLHGFEVKPTYFVTTPFKMTHDTNILAEDCYWSKQCSVISSPNFPEAGLGLVNRKKKTIPRVHIFSIGGLCICTVFWMEMSWRIQTCLYMSETD